LEVALLRAARAGRYLLAIGLLLLVLGFGLAVIRHDHAVAARAEAERARYDAALRRAAAQPPRFQVSYVVLPLAVVRRSSRGEYTMVKTEVARRIETGRPPLHLDPVVVAERYNDPDARALRQLGVREREVLVSGLLVTQTTPGAAVRMRLDAERLAINGVEDVVDAVDLLPPEEGSASIFEGRRAAGTKRRESVQWTLRSGETAFVPLSVLHLFPGTFLVTDGVVLGPRGLFVHTAQGSDTEIGIRPALDEPLIVTAVSKP
jgi:hypothetical protein